MGNCQPITEVLTEDQKAVLLVPGMVSNAIEARVKGACSCQGNACNAGGFESYDVAWIKPSALLKHPKILVSLKLEIDEESDEVTTVTPEGRDVRIVDGLDGIATLNPGSALPPIKLWYNMITHLEDIYSVVPFNYDWRRWGDVPFARDELVPKFMNLVEICAETTNKPVTIIGHSMGAPVAFYCMSQAGPEWVKENIDAIIMIGPAFGTPTMFPSYACGPIAGMFDIIPESIENKLAHITSTWPCMVAEFPFPVGDYTIFDTDYDFVQTPTTQYKYGDVQRFLNAVAQNVEDGIEEHDVFTYGAKYCEGCSELSAGVHPQPVPVHFIYGAGQHSPTRFQYASDDLTSVPTTLENQPGDNTVLASSVERLADYWKKAGHEVTLHKAPDAENHSSLLKCDYTLNKVSDLLEVLDETSELPAKRDHSQKHGFVQKIREVLPDF